MAEKPRVTKADYIPCPKCGELNHPSSTWCEKCDKLLASAPRGSELDEQAEAGWRFWVGWFLASAVVWTGGFIVGSVVAEMVRLALGLDEGTVMWCRGAVAGAALGLCQWAILQHRVSRAGWWALASAVAWTGGLAVGWFLGGAVGWVIRGGLAGDAILEVDVGAICGAVCGAGVLGGATTGAALVWLQRRQQRDPAGVEMLRGANEEGEHAQNQGD